MMNEELQRATAELVEKLSDVIRLVLADYEASKKVEIPEGVWIRWRGGERPVPIGTLVDVVHRNGYEFHNQLAGASGSYAEDWEWTGDHPADIIRYRIVPGRNK